MKYRPLGGTQVENRSHTAKNAEATLGPKKKALPFISSILRAANMQQWNEMRDDWSAPLMSSISSSATTCPFVTAHVNTLRISRGDVGCLLGIAGQTAARPWESMACMRQHAVTRFQSPTHCRLATSAQIRGLAFRPLLQA